MLSGRFAAIAAIALTAGAWAAAPVARVDADAQPQPAPGVDLKTFVSTYCLTCHNDRLRTGGLSLADPELIDPAAHPELWEKVLLKIGTGQMPPPRQPRPDPADVRRTISHIAVVLDRAAEAHPDPGHVGPHRLNRTE